MEERDIKPVGLGWKIKIVLLAILVFILGVLLFENYGLYKWQQAETMKVSPQGDILKDQVKDLVEDQVKDLVKEGNAVEGIGPRKIIVDASSLVWFDCITEPNRCLRRSFRSQVK